MGVGCSMRCVIYRWGGVGRGGEGRRGEERDREGYVCISTGGGRSEHVVVFTRERFWHVFHITVCRFQYL